jgi:hypothetical protein
MEETERILWSALTRTLWCTLSCGFARDLELLKIPEDRIHVPVQNRG